MSIGFGELIVILCVAFFVVGPEDLPKVARAVARLIKSIRSITSEATQELEKNLELEDKEDLEALKKTKQDIKEVKDSLQDDLNSLKP